jgi:hypothetical protein
MFRSRADHVILNRGNHEDFAICTVYGFQIECCEKYGDVIFGLFVEIFQVRRCMRALPRSAVR